MRRSLISTVISAALILGMFGGTVTSFAGNVDAEKDSAEIAKTLDYAVEMQKLSDLIAGDVTYDAKALTYIEKAVGQEEMTEAISKYKAAFNGDKAYEMLEGNLKNVYSEVEANDFSKEQAKALFIAATDLETGNAKLSEMTFSKTIPDFAPSHSSMEYAEVSENSGNKTMQAKAADPKSSRSNYETGGIGYEVKSTLGYNQTTSFLYAGNCNVTATEGKAGYMFYTIYYNGHYQDIGIGYFNGKWQAFVSGYWTNWGTGSVSIKSGDYIYFKLWIDNNNKINFQILDGDNFNKILFQNSYTSWNQIPANGKGVGFNKQSTLVDTAHNPNSGLYLKNARFKDAYLYNPSTYVQFKASNTDSSRRGKFGCTWAADTKVTVNSYSPWHTENVSIVMN